MNFRVLKTIALNLKPIYDNEDKILIYSFNEFEEVQKKVDIGLVTVIDFFVRVSDFFVLTTSLLLFRIRLSSALCRRKLPQMVQIPALLSFNNVQNSQLHISPAAAVAVAAAIAHSLKVSKI